MSANINQKYKETSLKTASPEKLIMMLYDGLIKDLNLAIHHMEKGNLAEVNETLIHAQEIAQELLDSLNLRADKEIVGTYETIYDYLLSDLMKANLNKDKEKLKDIKDIVLELKEIWKDVLKKAKGGEVN